VGVRSTFALYYVAILEELAWGRGPTALGYSLTWLGFVVFGPVAGALADRWGAPMVVIIGGALLGAALASTGQVTSLSQYYLCFGVLGAAGLACIIVPSTTIVTRWFARGRGTAMGVLSTGNPLSTFAFYPVNAWLIATLGWRGVRRVWRHRGGGDHRARLPLPRSAPPRPRARPRAPGPRAGTAGEAWTAPRARAAAGSGRRHHDRARHHRLSDHRHAPGRAHASIRGFEQARSSGSSRSAPAAMAGNVFGGWLSDQVGRGWCSRSDR
jgi:hypothetical protein